MGASLIARTCVCEDSGGMAAVLYPALLCKLICLLALMVLADEVPICTRLSCSSKLSISIAGSRVLASRITSGNALSNAM